MNYIQNDITKLNGRENMKILNNKLLKKVRKDQVDWRLICTKYKLSEEFIREYKDKVHWVVVCIHQKLSEDFIREFKDKVAWNWICKYQVLSEGFIEEFNNRIYWNLICSDQRLSEEFIIKYIDKFLVEDLVSQKNMGGYSENFQRTIVNIFIKRDIPKYRIKAHCYYFTPYMLEQYEKLAMFV